MKYVEEYGNLFSLPKYFYLCQCISADFVMGKGIAVEFNKYFNMKNRLRAKYTINGTFPRTILEDRVFNLVTKEKYWHKPTYESLQGALNQMHDIVKEQNIKYIGMPQIGSGLDRLDWRKVSNMIRHTFSDCDCYIVVKKFEKEKDDSSITRAALMGSRGFL